MDKIETRTEVGKGATSILEEELCDYIAAFTKKGVYVGDDKYLILYGEMRRYNEGERNTVLEETS